MRIPTFALALLLSACATNAILVSSPGQVSPATLKTFEFRSSEAVLAAGPTARHSDSELAALVTRKLTAKGYAPATAGSRADFVVTYRVAVFSSENPRDAYALVRDPTSLVGTDVAPDPAGSEGLVREATLVLMGLSGADDKVLWQATASGIATSRRELSAGALRTASAMLDRFPDRAR
jgi:hypothetical protein